MGEGGRLRRLESLLDIPLFPISLLHELTHYLVYRAAGVPAEMHFLDDDQKAHVTTEARRWTLPNWINTAAAFAPLALLALSVPAVLLTLRWLARSDSPLALVAFAYTLLLVVQSFPSDADIRTLAAAGWSDRRIGRTSLLVTAVAWGVTAVLAGVGGFVSV